MKGIPKRKTNLKHVIDFSNEKSRTDQSSIYSGDVDYMVRNLNINPQELAIANAQNQYADISDFPENLSEAINFVADVQHSFEGLPTDIKNIIGNDWTRFPELLHEDNAAKHKDVYAKYGYMQKAQKNDESSSKAQSTEQNNDQITSKEAATATE